MKSIIKFLLLTFMSFTAIFCLLIAYTHYSKVEELKEWQKITATVVSSAIQQEQREKNTTNCPIILVKYYFQGKPLTSKLDIENAPCSPVRSSVLNTIEKFTSTKSIEIFVNPANASQVRVTNFSLGTFFYLMILCAALLFYGATVFARSSTSPSFKRDT